MGNSSIHFRDSVANIYDMIINSSDGMDGNGFLRPFEIREFSNLMVSTFLFQTGIYVSYFLYLYTPDSTI